MAQLTRGTRIRTTSDIEFGTKTGQVKIKCGSRGTIKNSIEITPDCILYDVALDGWKHLLISDEMLEVERER